MSSVESVENKFFLGIDGGGSKCKAVVANQQGEVLGSGIGGPANPIQGYQKTIDSILNATEKALADAGLSDVKYHNLIAGVGLAGVNLPQPFQLMSQWQHPFSAFYLTTDLEIANIGAHDGSDGAVIIVGTGSCGFSSIAGRKISFGGHGFPMGDVGSGAWIGLEAVKHTLLVLDGFLPQSQLAQTICQQFSVDSGLALSEKLAGRSSHQFARIASLVFACADEEDKVAKLIVAQAIEYISQMLNLILQNSPQKISMIGGLAKFVLPRLSEGQQQLFSIPANQPEIGALTFAQRSWQIHHKQSA